MYRVQCTFAAAKAAASLFFSSGVGCQIFCVSAVVMVVGGGKGSKDGEIVENCASCN